VITDTVANRRKNPGSIDADPPTRTATRRETAGFEIAPQLPMRSQIVP